MPQIGAIIKAPVATQPCTCSEALQVTLGLLPAQPQRALSFQVCISRFCRDSRWRRGGVAPLEKVTEHTQGSKEHPLLSRSLPSQERSVRGYEQQNVISERRSILSARPRRQKRPPPALPATAAACPCRRSHPSAPTPPPAARSRVARAQPLPVPPQRHHAAQPLPLVRQQVLRVLLLPRRQLILKLHPAVLQAPAAPPPQRGADEGAEALVVLRAGVAAAGGRSGEEVGVCVAAAGGGGRVCMGAPRVGRAPLSG